MSDRAVSSPSTASGAFKSCIGGGEAQPVPTRGVTGLTAIPYSRSREGLITFEILTSENAGDIWVTSLDQFAEAQPFLTDEAHDVAPLFSPNGRYIAYTSDRSGVLELYVERYPRSSDRWSVTPGGSLLGIWSADGTELIYRAGNALFSMPVNTASPNFRSGEPVRLFERPFAHTGGFSFDVTPNGRRILLLLEPEATPPAHIRVVTNWLTELQANFSAMPSSNLKGATR